MENQRSEFTDQSQWMHALQKRKHQASSQLAPENAADMRKRMRIRYTKEEEEMLVKEVMKRWDELFGVKSRTLPRGAKAGLWNEIAARLEGTSQGLRAGEDLRKKWLYVKQCLLEKVEAQRLSAYPYSESNKPTDLTAVEKQLLSLLSQTAMQPVSFPDTWGLTDISGRSPADTDVFSSSTSSEVEFPSSSCYSGTPPETDLVRSLNPHSTERVNLSNLAASDDAQAWDPDVSDHSRRVGVCDDNEDEPALQVSNLILPAPRRLVRPGTDNVAPVLAAIVNRQRQCVSVQREAVNMLHRLAADVHKYVDYVTSSNGNANDPTSGLPANELPSYLSVRPTSAPPTDSSSSLPPKHSQPKLSVSHPLSGPHLKPQNLSLLHDDVLLDRFRLDRSTVAHLCEVLGPHLTNRRMPVESAVCATLAFYATGSFWFAVGDFGAGQPAVKNAVQVVTDALVGVSDQFIQFPRPRGPASRPTGFPQAGGVPRRCRGLGLRPRRHQITATADCRITSAVARFPGSFGCSHVLQHSPLEAFCTRGNLGKGHLIAHSGYPLRQWLLPPLQNPQVDVEVRYNKALLRSHAVVAKTLGLLRARFPCLDHAVSSLQCSPKKSARVILACCVLHNIAVSRHVKLPRGAEPTTAAQEHFNCEGEEDTPSDSEEILSPRVTGGQQKQACTIQRFFT
ncbi:hypothetical protein SKAU_G00012890 [Synaphobranchus kaupii]|uniref:Myb-like domain-containing protein n=1 Tax=Synaphobranchus kaupii TaxID=118154 RepID=A0A9Q1GBI9_SYNKA|nr:hypothetical protein SKAU_G00012890 [Synaphobranchus kaupii]